MTLLQDPEQGYGNHCNTSWQNCDPDRAMLHERQAVITTYLQTCTKNLKWVFATNEMQAVR